MQNHNAERALEADAERIKALEAALGEANARIGMLARERAVALTALAQAQRSLSFRLGALLTWPLRLLHSRSAGIFGRAADFPAAEETAALAAPVSAAASARRASPKPVPPESPPPSAKRSEHAGVPTPEYAAWARASLEGRAAPGPAPAAEPEPRAGDPYLAPPASPLADPSSRAFYEHNGFAVFRDLVDPETCFAAAQSFKRDLVSGDYLSNPHTTLNLAEVYPPGREYVFNPPLLGAMRSCLGEDIRFLQWSTYQLNHMSFPWHRDGAYRIFGQGLDWDESEHPYKVAKIILYLECADFALAVFPGSHKGEIDRTAISHDRRDFSEVKRYHRSAPADLSGRPCLVHARSGDAVVFDQRLMHCGRLLDETAGTFTKTIHGDKSFISFLYGADNPHSFRFFSYFNKERGLPVSPMGAELVDRLKRENLYLSIGQANHFDAHPLERRDLWLPTAGAAA